VLLRLDNVSRTIGGRTLFANASISAREGDRIGLIGPNGAGKTTLLRIAAGLDPPDAGGVHVPRHVRVALLRQELDPTRDRSVREEVASAQEALDGLERDIAALEAEMATLEGEVPEELAERYDRCRAAFAFGGGFEREARVERVLAGLGFDAEARGRPLHSFSGGWLMRVELARLLLQAPDVLLLDEPTNHLDLPSIQWFEQTLADYRGAVVMITHDRTFLRRHATRIAELEFERLVVFDGSYDRHVAQKEERIEQLRSERRNQDRRIAEQERFIERFRYKASKARQVQSRVKALDQIERVEVPEEDRRALRLRIPEPARAGASVLTLEGIHKAYDDHVVYAGVDFELRRAERVALAGPNGAGKSTLLRIAAGVLPPDRGDRRLGHNVTAAFFAQHQLEVLDPARTVLQELEAVARTDDTPRLRGHLGAFLFTGDDVDKKISVLSGGEKARVALARLLLRPVNLLILDEPTNHLDLAAREVLERALGAYAGTLLFISHDRTFINAVATRVVDVRDGRLRSFPGDYDDYLRGLSRGAGDVVAEAAPAARSTLPTDKQARVAARAHARERAKALERARRRVATIEQEILQQEESLEALDHKLAQPDVYRDGDLVRAVEAERGEVRDRIDTLYADWEAAAAEVESADDDPSPDAVEPAP
jgi:ATP-binding cassette subfamily F protein 3